MTLPLRTPDELDATELQRKLNDAMWTGDADKLNELAPCHCCCDEHTSAPHCPAYQWGGCRGQGAMLHEDRTAWVEHYRKFHGMTEVEFYAYEDA